MAGKKISQLTKLTELTGTEIIPVAKDGENYGVESSLLQATGEEAVTRLNNYITDVSELFGKLAVKGSGELVSDWEGAEHGYLNSNGEFVASETNRVLYIDIDKDSVYRLYNISSGSAGHFCLYDTDGKLIKSIKTIPVDGYYIFAGVAKMGISIYQSSINSAKVTRYQIQDINTVLNTQQGNRALYVAAGAVYNEDTGFYELNGLTDITEEQMRTIYNACGGNPNSTNLIEKYASMKNIRTNIPFHSASIGGYIEDSVRFDAMCLSCSNLEVFSLGTDTNIIPSSLMYAFQSCVKLKSFIGIFNFANSPLTTNAFNNCVELRDIKIKSLKRGITFKDSPLLSLASLQYLITNAANTATITVTVHADVFAKINDETNTEWHALLAAAEAKQITFATA